MFLYDVWKESPASQLCQRLRWSRTSSGQRRLHFFVVAMVTCQAVVYFNLEGDKREAEICIVNVSVENRPAVPQSPALSNQITDPDIIKLARCTELHPFIHTASPSPPPALITTRHANELRRSWKKSPATPTAGSFKLARTWQGNTN